MAMKDIEQRVDAAAQAGTNGSAAPASTPGEYDDEAIVKRAKEDARRAIRFASGWREDAREDFRFAAGEQWEPEEKETLNEQGRPCLVINKIAVQLDALNGYERNNSARLKVSPEGTEDKLFSEVCDKALAYVDKIGHMRFKQHQQFDDGLVCGKGMVELALSYLQDPLFGDLLFRTDGPFAWYFDPDSQEYDRSDAEFGVKVKRYSKARLKAMYPKKAEVIDHFGPSSPDEWFDVETVKVEGDADNYGQRPSPGGTTPARAYSTSQTIDEGLENRITLLEYWYKRYVPRYFLFDIEQNRLVKFDTQDQAKARIATLITLYSTIKPGTNEIADPEAVAALQTMTPIERQVPEMWLLAFAHGEIMVHGKSPMEPRYSGFPAFNFLSYWRPSAESESQRIQGLVRRMKDPQREINKARSQYLHILNTGANSGWIGDDDALKREQWKMLEEFGSKPGIVIKKKPGSTLTQIEPVAPSYAQNLREKTATENLKEVTGINADLLALEDKQMSGKAIALRIKQAMTIVAGVFDNWKMTKRLVGEAIFKLLPQIMDAKKLSRIVGQAFLEANQVTEGQLGAILTQIEDGRYDVAVAEATDSPTLRQETFEQLLEIQERSGQPMPPSLMLKWSNIPNAAEAAKEVEAYQAQQAQLAAAGAGAK